MPVEGPVRKFEIGESGRAAEVRHLHAWNAADDRVPVSDVVKDGCFDAVALTLLRIEDCGGHRLTINEPGLVGERGLVAIDVPCRGDASVGAARGSKLRSRGECTGAARRARGAQLRVRQG